MTAGAPGRRLRAAAVAIACAALAQAARAEEERVRVETRPGVTQEYLLGMPPDGRVHAVAVLFPGGRGHVDPEFERRRGPRERGNFLVRSRAFFAARGVATAVIAPPSDRPGGMSDEFRADAAHAADLAAVVADVAARIGDVPRFLVGTSRGTVSAAWVGRRLAGRLAGVVLTATVFRAGVHGEPLAHFDFSGLPARRLFVHHADDGCRLTPYADAPSTATAARAALITVRGGLPARSGPCQAMSPHGFLGREEATVDAIVDWMLQRRFPSEID